jgi:hypothetical protein
MSHSVPFTNDYDCDFDDGALANGNVNCKKKLLHLFQQKMYFNNFNKNKKQLWLSRNPRFAITKLQKIDRLSYFFIGVHHCHKNINELNVNKSYLKLSSQLPTPHIETLHNSQNKTKSSSQ